MERHHTSNVIYVGSSPTGGASFIFDLVNEVD